MIIIKVMAKSIIDKKAESNLNFVLIQKYAAIKGIEKVIARAGSHNNS